MKKQIHVLIIEDNQDDALLEVLELTNGGFEVESECVETENEMREALKKKKWDCIISDYSMPRFSGLEALRVYKESGLDIPFILVSGTIGEEIAVEAMKAGVHDYIMKTNLHRLVPSLEHELEDTAVRHKLKLNEKELIEKDILFRRLIEKNSDIITLVNTNGQIMYESSAVETITGYAIEERAGKSIFELIHPDDIANVKQTFKDISSTPDNSKSVLLRIYRKDGTLRWTEAIGTNLLHDPVVKAIVINIKDVSSRIISEEKLRQSEEKYRYLFEQASDGIFIADQNGNYTDVNTSGCLMLGYTKDEILKLKISDIVFKDDVPRLKTEFQVLLKNGIVKSEWQFCRKDKSVFWGEVITKQLSNNRLQAFIRDITERKQAEEKLIKSEERYRLISENAVDVIWILDPISGKFTFVSPSVEKLRGYTPAEVMAQSVKESLTPESYELLINTLKKTLPSFIAKKTGSESHTNFIDQPCKDGTIVNTEVTSTYVFNQSGNVEIIGVSRNITERKKAEIALQESETRYRNLFENAPVGVFQVTVDGKIISVNAEYARIFGFSNPQEAKQTINQSSLSKAIFENPEERIKLIKKAKEFPGYWINSEQNYLRKNGSKVIGNLAFRVLPDNQDIIEGFIEDITFRKISETALQVSENRYRSLLNNLDAGVVVHAPDTSIIMNNQRASELLGLSDDQLKGRAAIDSYWKFIDKNGKPLPIEDYPVNKVISTNKPFNNLLLGAERSAGGDSVWFNVNGLPAYNNDGELVEILISFIDITARLKAEEKLRESEMTFSEMFQKSPVTIILTNPFEGTVLDVNETFLAEMEYTHDEVIGHTTLELGLFNDENDRQILVDILKKSNSVFGYECSFRSKNGKIMTGLISIVFIKLKGRICQLSTIVDITVRKKIEESLKDNNLFLKTLLNAIPAPVFYKDINGCYTKVNKAFEDFFGKTNEELKGKNVFAIAPKELAEFHHSNDLKLLQNPGLLVYDSQALDYKNEIREGVFHKAAILDSNDDIRGLVGVILDITDRKLTEISLKESEEKYKILIENANEAIYVVQDEVIVFANSVCENITGFSKDELIGMSIYNLVFDFEKQRLKKHHIDLIYEKTTEDNDTFLIKTSTNEKRWLSVNSARIIWNGIPSTLNLATDITERKQIEEALQESEEIFNHFMQNSPIYIFFKDKEARAVKLSNNFEQMLGKTLNEMIGKTMYDLFPTDFAKKMVEDEQRIMNEGKLSIFDEELNGRFYNTIKFPIIIDNEACFLAGYTIDITERKRAEDKIKSQLDELRRWNEATLNREDRIIEIKREVNELLAQIGKPVRYQSVDYDTI